MSRAAGPVIRADLRAALAALPQADRTDIVAHRHRVADGIVRDAAQLDPRGVGIRDVLVTARDRATAPLRVRVYEPPRRPPGEHAGLLWIHGGAFSTGLPEAGDRLARDVVEALGITVVSPDYRLAPEYPFPAAFDDCLDALRWMTSAEALGLRRFAVGGASAGGTLAAALAVHARDVGAAAPALQLLLYPPLDDRAQDDGGRYRDAPVFTSEDARVMWQRYLPPGAPVSPYAAPARASSLAGVAPVHLVLADHDPLRDAGLVYAQRLVRDGVPTELHHLQGTFHGFDVIAPDAPVTRSVVDGYLAALRDALVAPG